MRNYQYVAVAMVLVIFLLSRTASTTATSIQPSPLKAARHSELQDLRADLERTKYTFACVQNLLPSFLANTSKPKP